ncbi:RNA polymerase sigma factor [Muriicola sp. Z0-33]|uniref:RNA polymerase sigma factor n=1 Tax=Muriicola sp. Z0-33 TaxID=2816957 RepID=UPI002237ABE6|nr:sigma-70 family RNA polymerase sigma factor [Muriicola sp. Z0-33]MCW5517358.1 sigma-70 family RNA polymerase sigma factor [Muriicola sp. Z0-33]
MATALTDIQLIDALRNGDKSALYQLYDRYSGALYGVIIRMCRDEALAKDLLQESFIKIWQKIASYDADKGKFYTWSYRITKNTTLNALRKSRNLIQNEDLSVYDNKSIEEPKPDYTQLNGAIKNLEPHHQKAIDLVYFQGLTHKEAHLEMAVPLGTFKSYIKQALKKIREGYGPDVVLLLIFMLQYG